LIVPHDKLTSYLSIAAVATMLLRIKIDTVFNPHSDLRLRWRLCTIGVRYSEELESNPVRISDLVVQMLALGEGNFALRQSDTLSGRTLSFYGFL
jgi:hypothetical protein